MSGYIDGMVKIWCSDNPPDNQNTLWYRRFIRGAKDIYILYEYNNYESIWQPLNSALEDTTLVSENNNIIISEDESGGIQRILVPENYA